jgi:tRNA U34 2-thiouridine synthase MnmA/TrmU
MRLFVRFRPVCPVCVSLKSGRHAAQYIRPNPGPIIDSSGRTIGTHQGLWSYTIGQGARISGMREKMFVASKDLETNQIMVVPGT